MEHTAGGELERHCVERAQRGDAGAFVELVQQYQTPVYNLAYRMLGNASDAEDAAQETFLRAYTQLATFDSKRRFAAWLLGIAAHYCIDRLRRLKFSGPSLDDERIQETFASNHTQPDDAVIASERETDAQRLLAELPPAYRAVVVLKYWNDMSLEEISRATGDSVGAVKVKLYRARLAMARSLIHHKDVAPAEARPRASEGV